VVESLVLASKTNQNSRIPPIMKQVILGGVEVEALAESRSDLSLIRSSTVPENVVTVKDEKKLQGVRTDGYVVDCAIYVIPYQMISARNVPCKDGTRLIVEEGLLTVKEADDIVSLNG